VWGWGKGGRGGRREGLGCRLLCRGGCRGRGWRGLDCGEGVSIVGLERGEGGGGGEGARVLV